MNNYPGLEVRIIHTIEQINSRDWYRTFPETLESYFFYKTVEESESEYFSFYYIGVYSKGELLAVAPAFLMNYSLDTTIQGFLKRITSALNKILPGMFSLKVLMCGSPASEGEIGLPQEHRIEAFAALLRGLEELARKEHALGIAFKDFSDKYSSLLDPLVKQGFCKMNGYPSVKIDLHFKSFEEYLLNLGRSTRKSLRRKFRNLARLPKVEREVTDSLGAYLEEAHKLYLQTFDKSEVHFEEYSEEFLLKIAQNMPQETKYFLWRINGKLAAFNLCLVSQDTIIDEFLGMDYSVAYTYSLYFLTFRDIITWSIEHGIKRYESGAMAYEAKRRLRHTFVPLYIYVRNTNPLLKPFLRPFCYLCRPENFDQSLRVVYKKLKNEKTQPLP